MKNNKKVGDEIKQIKYNLYEVSIVKVWPVKLILEILILSTITLMSFYLVINLIHSNYIYTQKAKNFIKESTENQQKIDIELLELNKFVALAKEKIAQDKILDCLLFLESTNNYNKVIIDVNNKYSIGGYQFQVNTVQDILKRYEKRDISTSEAVSLAKSPIESRELARRAIFDYQLGSKWYTSFEKMKKGKCEGLVASDLAVLGKN